MISNKKIYLLLLAIISFSCSDLGVEQLDYTNEDVVVYFNIDANSNYWGPGYISNIQTIGDEACPAMRIKAKMPHAREKMKKFVASLEEDDKDIINKIKASFKHLNTNSFCDERYLDE